jgi:hypothetical protein
MFEPINCIKGVTLVFSKNNDLILQNAQGEVYFNNLMLGMFGFQIEFLVWNHKVFVSDWEGNYWIFSNDAMLLDAGKGKAFYYVCESFLGIQFLVDGSVYEGLIDNQDRVVFNVKYEKYNNQIAIYNNELIVLKSPQEILRLSNSNGNRRWQFDISEIGEFISPIGNKPAEEEQLIGVYGQILWVYLGNGKLIGLDAQTGTLVHELNDTPERNIHGGTMRPLADGGKRERFIHYYLDQSAGKLIGLSFNTYCEVDLELDSPSFEFWIIKEQMPSWGIKEFAHNTAWDGHNSLFFFDANAHLWGVFDITQRQIVWVSDPISIPCKADSFTQLREIQYGAGKVYVLDSAQTLYVFEKVE